MSKCLVKKFPSYPLGSGEPLKVVRVERVATGLRLCSRQYETFKITEKSVSPKAAVTNYRKRGGLIQL